MAIFGDLGKILGLGTAQETVQAATGSPKLGMAAGVISRGVSKIGDRVLGTEQGQSVAVSQATQTQPQESQQSGVMGNVVYGGNIQPASFANVPMPPATQQSGFTQANLPALFFGGVDMAADLRCENTWENLLFARSKIVHAAASAGIDVLDVPYLDLENMDGMKKEAILAKNLGFSGKGSIHPKQIKILNDVFTPSEAEIKLAEKIVDEFEKSGKGLLVIDGKLIEKPVLREMQRKLSISKRLK